MASAPEIDEFSRKAPTREDGPRWPEGTVRALLATDLVTEPTRDVLRRRLQRPDTTEPSFLDAGRFRLLQAVCARLVPQPDRTPPVDIAGLIDARLADGGSDGWRYAVLPPDRIAQAQGLDGIAESASALFGRSFHKLDGAERDAVLLAVQKGTAPGPTWRTLPGPRYFEELLAEVVDVYYAHPLAQEEIGYVGMADARGWQAVGLNQRAGHEPSALVDARMEVAHDDRTPHGFQTLHTAPDLHGREVPMRRYRPDETVDAVVIGTGAGGAPLLARLARAGLSVVALEAGRHWAPARDFATDESEQNKLFWTDERLSEGEDPIAFGKNNSGIGVGGSTLHYTAYTPRAQPDDFRLRAEFGVGVDWPIGYGDLEPYYGLAERIIGVSGPSIYPWGPPRREPYPLAPLPLNGAAQLMERGCAALGIRTSPAANAALSGSYYQEGIGWRSACTNCGFCQAGCNKGAKGSMDVTFVPLAIAAGAEVRSESFVLSFETDTAGRITAVVYERDGVEERQLCRHVFLCAGAIETPRLLLINGLGNASGEVGRNFMAHTGIQLWGRFDDDVRPYKGIPGSLISEDTHRPADADFAGGYLLQSIGVMPLTYAGQVARGRGLWGEALTGHMRSYNHTAGINILGDCLPSPDNHLTLSDETDGRGLPKPLVRFSNGENERRMTTHAEKIMRNIWDAAGAREVWAFPRNAHTIGTCRMGHDGEHAVVDPDGRAFDVPNLTICDNSVFPSALSVNPALTIMALSLRTADRFLTRRGDATPAQATASGARP